MFALPNVIPADAAGLRRIVTDPTAPRSLQRLAWAALKTAQGNPVRQARLAEMALGGTTAAPRATLTPAQAVACAIRREALRLQMLARDTVPRHTPTTGGDAA